MWAGTWERSWLFPRKTMPRHKTVAAASLLISLLAHVLILGRLPPFLAVGTPPVPPEEEQPLIVRDVQFAPTRQATDPGTVLYRPEAVAPPDPSGLRPRGGEAPLNPLIQRPDLPPQPLPAADSPLKPEPPATAFPAWTPRAERLELTRMEQPAFPVPLPRRVEPAIARSSSAPDFTLPAPVSRDMEQTPPPLPPARAVSFSKTPSLGALPGSLTGEGSGTGASDGPLAWSGRIEELLEDSLRAEPRIPGGNVERFLAMDLQVYRPEHLPDVQYFRITIRRDGPESLPILPKDVLFILDSSQSMTQPVLNAGKEGIRQAFSILAPGDRFNVASFREDVQVFSPDWVSADAIERARASWFLEQIESRGRTDLLGSFQPVLDAAKDRFRPALALIISDGLPTTGRTDDFEILETFRAKNAGAIPVFAFGAGASANRFLLDFLSRQNRGDTRMVSSVGDVPAGIGQFAAELGRPVLYDVSARFLNVDPQSVYPRSLTPFFLDRPLVMVGRIPADAGDAAVRMMGRGAEGRLRDAIYRLSWSRAGRAGPDLEQEWVSLHLAALISEYIRTRNPRLIGEIRACCEQNDLPMPYAERLGAGSEDGHAR